MNRFVVMVSDGDFKDCEPRSSRSQDSLILTKEQYRVILESAERVGTWDKIQKSISVRCETCGSFVIPVQPFYETITQVRDDANIEGEFFDIDFSTDDLYEIDDLLFEKVYVFQSSALERRKKDTLEEDVIGTEFCFSSPEDTIINKLQWYELGERMSERQWLDVIGVIKVQGDLLDKHYLLQWSQRLGIEQLLIAAFDNAGVQL